jgi:hypothetical protein
LFLSVQQHLDSFALGSNMASADALLPALDLKLRKLAAASGASMPVTSGYKRC